jgi:hypothetical protein
MLSVFLSHSSKDKAFVRRLSEELAGYRVKIWLDERELQVGDPLSSSLRRGVATSKYVVVVVSPNSVGSPWVREEILMAKDASRTGHARLVPILLGDVPRDDLERLIGDRLFADFSQEDLFFVSLAKLLRTMGLQRSFSDMLAPLGQIDPIMTRQIGINEVSLGRELLIELSHQPALDVSEYRNWLFWEILRHHLRGVYPIEVCVGTAADGEACFTFRDPMLNRAASARLLPSQSQKGVWDFELKQRKDLRPTTRQRPTASPDRVVTHLGFPDVESGSEEALNPWTLAGCDQEIDCLLRDTCEQLESMGTEVTRSFLIDFGLVTFGCIGMAQLRFGDADFPEGCIDGSCARGRSLESTCRVGDGSLLAQIFAPFFASTNLITLCGVHRAGELRVRVDVFHSGENQILDTGPPKLGTG